MKKMTLLYDMIELLGWGHLFANRSFWVIALEGEFSCIHIDMCWVNYKLGGSPWLVIDFSLTMRVKFQILRLW